MAAKTRESKCHFEGRINDSSKNIDKEGQIMFGRDAKNKSRNQNQVE